MITIHGVSADYIRRNLDDRYRAATEDQRERGLKWYLDARDEVMSAAGDEYLLIGCEVLALLSPRCPWEVNIEAFRRIASGSWDSPGNSPGLHDTGKVGVNHRPRQSAEPLPIVYTTADCAIRSVSIPTP